MKKAGLKLTAKGDISDSLGGVQIERKPDSTIHLTQPHLIKQILEDLRLNGPDVATKNTLAKVRVALHRHTGSQLFDGHLTTDQSSARPITPGAQCVLR